MTSHETLMVDFGAPVLNEQHGRSIVYRDGDLDLSLTGRVGAARSEQRESPGRPGLVLVCEVSVSIDDDLTVANLVTNWTPNDERRLSIDSLWWRVVGIESLSGDEVRFRCERSVYGRTGR